MAEKQLYKNPEVDELMKMKGSPDKGYLHIKNEQEAEERWEDIGYLISDAERGDFFKKNPMILDIGGGDAAFADYLNKKHNLKCVSLDIQKYAKKNEADRVTADMYHLPFADDSFDMIVSNSALDANVYVHDLTKLLPELARVLKKGGLFCDMMFSFMNEKNIEEMVKYFKRVGDEQMVKEMEGDNEPHPIWEKI